MALFPSEDNKYKRTEGGGREVSRLKTVNGWKGKGPSPSPHFSDTV